MNRNLLVGLALSASLPCFAQTQPITMEELASAFSSNPIASKRRFSDFLVTGTVSAIYEGEEPGTANILFIRIDRDAGVYKSAYSVRAVTTEDDAITLAKGSPATFRCRSSRKEPGFGGGQLILESCRISF